MSQRKTLEERKAISREAKFQNRINRLRTDNPDLIIRESCRCGCERQHHRDRTCWVCMDCSTYRPVFEIRAAS